MKKGYYRVKIKPTNSITTVGFKVNGELACTHIVNARCWNDGDQYLKYIDRYGRYRFHKFNSRYTVRHNPENIGSTEKVVTDIFTDQGNSNDIGFRNNRTFELTSDFTTSDEMSKLKDIFHSPAVYLLIGSDDELSSWVFVKVSGDNLEKENVKERRTFSLTVTLPEFFTLTRI